MCVRRGSSPRARRTLVSESRNGEGLRIIPACAENAARPPTWGNWSADHPRVRGERAGWVTYNGPRSGSSPRARRTLHQDGGRLVRDRIIPACAENAGLGWWCRAESPDHPRVRGERRAEKNSDAVAAGSSPRARRTHGDGVPAVRAGRIIPACAENASGSCSCSTASPDHPRVRGERVISNFDRPAVTGSSPRARRTRILRRAKPHRDRIIPACAENARARP